MVACDWRLLIGGIFNKENVPLNVQYLSLNDIHIMHFSIYLDKCWNIQRLRITFVPLTHEYKKFSMRLHWAVSN